MPEIIQNQPSTQKPARRKKNKETHNAVERHRKEKINAGIQRIGDLLPCSQALKQSKNMILGEAFNYISKLKQQNDEMLLSGADKVQAEEIKRLRQQVEDLRKESGHYIDLLKANGINFLDDPTIHWKGKQRCAKVAKITPTHLTSKGIIVYSSENSASSTSKVAIPPDSVSHQDKQIGAGQTLNEITVVSSTSSQIPLATLVPAVSKPCVAVVEQYTAMAPVAPKLPPPVNYITLQGLCPKIAVTAPVPHQTQPAKPTQSLMSSTGCPVSLRLQHVLSLTSSPQTVVSNAPLALPQNSENVSLAQALPTSVTHLRTSAASSTQTTWSTLQVTGNTVQPVCQSLAIEASSTGHNIPQLSVCPVVSKPFQDQTPVPVQLQTPQPTHIPQLYPPSGDLQTAMVTKTSLLPQTTLVTKPVVLHQASVVSQTALLTQPQKTIAQPTILPKPVPSSTQSHTYPAIQPKPQLHHAIPPQPEVPPAIPFQPQPQPAVGMPQAQSATVPPFQHAVVPQSQAATLPVLQTMQVLQVNSDGTPIIAAPPPQSNPNVVILQQANPCPAPQVIREDLTNQAACQHIVIIQTPTMTPAPQNHQTNVVPTAVPTLASQITNSSNACTTAVQANVAKQLVHILPRPLTQVQTQTPQTITVNGKVYVLQSAKSVEKGNSQVTQSATQIIQPSSEEPNTNVALNCLGALTSLSQGISQVSKESNAQPLNIPASSDTTVQPSTSKMVLAVGTSAEPVATTATPVSSESLSRTVNVVPKTTNQPKQASGKRVRPVRRKSQTMDQKRSKSKKFSKPVSSCVSGETAKQGHVFTNTDFSSTKSSENTTSQSTPLVTSITSTVSCSTASGTPANATTVTSTVGDVEVPQTKVQPASAPPPARHTEADSSAVQTNTSTGLTHTIDLEQNESAVGLLSSQSSTLDGGNTSSLTSIISNYIALISPSNSTVSSCSAGSKPTQSSPNLVENKTSLTGGSSADKNIAVTCVDSSLVQQKNVPVVSSAEPTRGEAASVSQKVPQIQTQSAKAESCKSLDRSQVQIPFTLPSTPVTSDSVSRGLSQVLLKEPVVSTSISSTSHVNSVGTKTTEANKNKKNVHGEHLSANPEHVTVANSFMHKEAVLSQDASALESESFDPSLGSNRQTDSPMGGATGNKRFSVASLLPPGHNTSAPASTFGSFSFTSEQTEILAMAARAIFEQDSPGQRSGSCSVAASSTTTTGWEHPKTQQAPVVKERVTSQQMPKQVKQDLHLSKTSHIEVAANSVRLPPSTAYSQSQPATLTSLNVTNLIRPSSVQPYAGSPNLSQQVSVSSPAVGTVLISQTSSQVTQSCSGPVQVNEYTPLKTALMRSQIGVAMAERHQKDLPKRSAQDDLVLPINKRSKPCPGSTVTRADVTKAAEHVQVMSGQMASSSSSVMTRNPSDGGGPMFSGNNFMSTVLRPLDGHCPVQLAPHEQNQPSVLQLQQGHAQHNTPQPGPNLGGNHYLKHQQQQEQQRHLYQLQHHLTQPDTQIHNIQQRVLLQDQNVHKKRVVRGGQTGPPVGLQKNSVQHQSHQQHAQQHQQSQQHQQQAQQHQQQQSQQHQQQTQQHQQQSQQHQQQAQQHQQQQSQQHQQQQSQQHPPHQQQPQQHQQQKPQQLQQQQQIQQSSHPRHQQLQQQLQQQQHFSRQEKNCEGQQGPRAHQSNHLGQQDRQPGQDHGAMQRLISSRTLEQHLTSQASNPVSRSSDHACTPSRQERHRLSSYSAEALIGKTSSAADQRLGLHLQTSRGNPQDPSELQGYVDSSHGKTNIGHNQQSRPPQDHPGSADLQRLSECLPFKTISNGPQHNNFEVQASRNGDMNSKSLPTAQRGPQSQTSFRIGAGPSGDGRARGTYGAHSSAQGLQGASGLPREQDSCHQSFMQSLLAPHLPEQAGHQRGTQGCPPASIEYSCVPGVSSGELQVKVSSPNLHPSQTAPQMHLGDNSKGHISQGGGNLHGSSLRSVLPHPPSTPHSSSDTGRAQGTSRSLSAVSQRVHHIGPESQSTKNRPGDRPRSGNLRPVNTFEPENPLPLTSSGGVLLGRPQTGSEPRRRGIVRFMPDGAQVGADNNLVSDQHLTQNFGFPFIAEGGMNHPPSINANASFIPPVTQSNASRTPALLPVEPQNTLPSFYPSYSPAAHPSLSSEIPLQYFSNQMFTSPSADKSSTTPLNNRFGSILSPPRPVGFAQASYPLLPDMTPMPIANSSSITPHLSNFNLTSLFPEIATVMPPDGSSMPMSPLLSLASTTSSDSNKQSNRPAHNISHILGHDGTSAV
ncbi:basic helix-loop-helix domain-containing protein USF3 [Trichomycterus rosablanca]|uniref:basic helix-loop-helix domain-containing protein USF3 n=1 Tax=Trichomycterus rosablanca TaxID=2290929 RepID=UPI002F35E130